MRHPLPKFPSFPDTCKPRTCAPPSHFVPFPFPNERDHYKGPDIHPPGFSLEFFLTVQLPDLVLCTPFLLPRSAECAGGQEMCEPSSFPILPGKSAPTFRELCPFLLTLSIQHYTDFWTTLFQFVPIQVRSITKDLMTCVPLGGHLLAYVGLLPVRPLG